MKFFKVSTITNVYGKFNESEFHMHAYEILKSQPLICVHYSVPTRYGSCVPTPYGGGTKLAAAITSYLKFAGRHSPKSTLSQININKHDRQLTLRTFARHPTRNQALYSCCAFNFYSENI